MKGMALRNKCIGKNPKGFQVRIAIELSRYSEYLKLFICSESGERAISGTLLEVYVNGPLFASSGVTRDEGLTKFDMDSRLIESEINETLQSTR